MRLSPLLPSLVLLASCAVGEDGDPLKPQPEPEHVVYLAIEPSLVHFERTSAGLVVAGDAGAVNTLGMQVVVTEHRSSAPIVEVSTGNDAAFSTTLASTGDTTVQLTPVLADNIGASLVYRIDADGVVTRVSTVCLTGVSGLWQLGNVHTGPGRLQANVQILNHCAEDVALDSLTLRSGAEFSVDATAFPRTIAVGGRVEVPVAFELGETEPRDGPARYDFVQITTTPALDVGFVLRVTRQPPTR